VGESKSILTILNGKPMLTHPKYDRGSGACKAQTEGGEKDTVFVLEDGATLRNVIIGKDQAEGVYCLGACNLEYVWFEDVCEDAISLKGDGTANIIGGGAYHASDKVIQHSCGNCKGNSNCSRKVNMSGIIAKDGGELIGINTNLGDSATYSNNCFDTKTQCQGYNGCDKANGECEPSKASAC
jgi:hypothetical protein